MRWSRLALAALGSVLARSVAALPTGGDLLHGGAAVVHRGESARVDVGDPAAHSSLLSGFYREESAPGGRTFAWARADSEVALVLRERGDRTLVLAARAVADGVPVTAWMNEHALGVRPVGAPWGTVSWEVPAGAVRRGLNRVRFRAEARRIEGDGRELALCIDEVGVEPASTTGSVPAPEPVTGAATLSPGDLLVVPIVLPPAAVLRLSLEGEGRVEILVGSEAEERSAGAIAGSEAKGAETRGGETQASGSGTGESDVALPLGPCCDVAGSVTLVALGPGPVTVRAATVTTSAGALHWRLACHTYSSSGLPIAGIAVSVVLLIYSYRYRRGWRWTPTWPWPPWVDVVLVVAIALAARWAFLLVQPGIDPGRWADAWEYLHRARRLASGEASFLADTSWHAWQSWIRPPGYYLFLAGVLGPFGGDLQSVVRIQTTLGALAAGGTYLVAYPLFGRGAALLAGLGFAFYLEAILTVPLVMTESLFLAVVLPGLGALAAVSRRPRPGLALLGGAALGLAALIRSTPFLFALPAALLLVVAHGRTAIRSALALLAGVALAAGPWCVRNAAVIGAPVGIDDMGIPNFLYSHPDQRYVPWQDLDLDDPEQLRRYYARVKSANQDRRLDRDRGIIRNGLVTMAREPVATARRFSQSVLVYLGPTAPDDVGEQIGEERPCRLVALADLLNAGYLGSLVLGLAGMALHARDRRTWPVALWFFFTLVLVNLFFPRSDIRRYRHPTQPVAFAFAGAALVRVGRRILRSS